MSEDKLDKKKQRIGIYHIGLLITCILFFNRARKWRFWMAAYFIARLRRGRTSICNNLVLYGSDGKPMGVNYGKFWLDAEHTVAGLKLL